MINLAPKLMFQIMNDRARSRYSLQHLRAAKSIQRFDFEVLAQSKDCLFWQKRVAVVAKRILNFLKLLLLLVADEKSRRRKSRSVSAGMLPRTRRYCCIIGVSASRIISELSQAARIASFEYVLAILPCRRPNVRLKIRPDFDEPLCSSD